MIPTKSEEVLSKLLGCHVSIAIHQPSGVPVIHTEDYIPYSTRKRVLANYEGFQLRSIGDAIWISKNPRIATPKSKRNLRVRVLNGVG